MARDNFTRDKDLLFCDGQCVSYPVSHSTRLAEARPKKRRGGFKMKTTQIYSSVTRVKVYHGAPVAECQCQFSGRGE